jgi:hypothetical protein
MSRPHHKQESIPGCHIIRAPQACSTPAAALTLLNAVDLEAVKRSTDDQGLQSLSVIYSGERWEGSPLFGIFCQAAGRAGLLLGSPEQSERVHIAQVIGQRKPFGPGRLTGAGHITLTGRDLVTALDKIRQSLS